MHFVSIHFVMIVGSLVLAWGLRQNYSSNCGDSHLDNWQMRWHKALVCFVLPPLLVLMTAIALLCMGADGQMIGLQAGRFSYSIAVLFLIYSFFRSGQLAWMGWRSLQKLQKLVVHQGMLEQCNSEQFGNSDCFSDRQESMSQKSMRLIDVPLLFAAQIGFWRSQLFVSQGLLDTLDAPHLEAVLLHERAHAHYRDTFWFFWLSCLRQIMTWLPNTQTLWEELLLLREIRADRWAAQHIDNLLLAESLLAMVSNNMTSTETFAAAFGAKNNSDRNNSDRLEERIDFLLAEPLPIPKFYWRSLLWIGFALSPLTVLPFHS